MSLGEFVLECGNCNWKTSCDHRAIDKTMDEHVYGDNPNRCDYVDIMTRPIL